MTTLPREIGQLTLLTFLSVRCAPLCVGLLFMPPAQVYENGLEELPSTLCQLQALEHLEVRESANSGLV